MSTLAFGLTKEEVILIEASRKSGASPLSLMISIADYFRGESEFENIVEIFDKGVNDILFDEEDDEDYVH